MQLVCLSPSRRHSADRPAISHPDRSINQINRTSSYRSSFITSRGVRGRAVRGRRVGRSGTGYVAYRRATRRDLQGPGRRMPPGEGFICFHLRQTDHCRRSGPPSYRRVAVSANGNRCRPAELVRPVFRRRRVMKWRGVHCGSIYRSLAAGPSPPLSPQSLLPVSTKHLRCFIDPNSLFSC